MIHRKAILLFTLLASNLAQSQISIEQTLISIEENNKTLNSANQLLASKELEFRTGITLENPFVTADYMIGRPVSGGNQFDFLAIQAFDFPSTYAKKNELAEKMETMTRIQLQTLRQAVLLESKQTMIEIIHLNKQQLILKERLATSTALVENYQRKFDAEQISALELNKAKIQRLKFQTQLRNIENNLEIATQHLTELNGGIELRLIDLDYPVIPNVPDFEVLEDSIEANDPKLKALDQQVAVYESTLALKKAMALPKFEFGYHYQSVLGQTFNGAHFGISIPLWEKKNTIKLANTNIQLGSMRVEEHKIQHYYEVKELYEKYITLSTSIEEYRDVLNSLNSEQILQKSLELGEINFITYSSEIQYYYDANDALSELERQHQIVLAELFKYHL